MSKSYTNKKKTMSMKEKGIYTSKRERNKKNATEMRNQQLSRD